MSKLKIVCISDTHCQLNKIKIPDGDILFHSGDATYSGTLQEVNAFAQHMKQLTGFSYKIFIPGNHDFLFETNPSLSKEILDSAGVQTLINESTEICGLKIYGSPITPKFGNWAFMLDKKSPGIKEHWKQIPSDIDILLTHGPAYGILDYLPNFDRVGCTELYLEMLRFHNLKMHVFGHIHYSYKAKQGYGGCWFVNAASCDEDYQPINKPFVFEYDTINKTLTLINES